MERAIYEKACKANQTLTTLFQRLNLPYHNFYALMHEVFNCSAKLSQDDDFLLLLMAIWGPSKHLFNTFWPRIQVNIAPDFDENAFMKLEPLIYEKLCISIDGAEKYSRNACSSSATALVRFPVYRDLLYSRREQLSAYEEWSNLYNKHRKSMKAETNRLKATDEYEPIQPRLILDVLQIFKEYVSNLCVDSKNRTKYEPIVNRVDSYISGLHAEDEGASDAADDVIGTVFERLLIYATRYEPLRKIGPAYIHWIFTNRPIKIGNPKDEKVNLLLTNSPSEDIFPFNQVWHDSHPSIADKAQVYLFDEICALWERNNFGDTTLSKFLFEKVTPYYKDFIKWNPKSTSKKREVRHDYIDYEIYTHSNEFLVRAVHEICSNLIIRPQIFSVGEIGSHITLNMLHDYMNESPKSEVSRLIEIFSKDDLLDCYFENTDYDIVIKDFIHATYEVAKQDRNIKQFEKIFLLDKSGAGGSKYSLEWNVHAQNSLLQLGQKIDYIWSDGDYIPYGLLFDIVVLVCSKSLYFDYCQRTILFSKRALFRGYTQCQYAQLSKFVNDLLPIGDTCLVTPVHFTEPSPDNIP